MLKLFFFSGLHSSTVVLLFLYKKKTFVNVYFAYPAPAAVTHIQCSRNM